MNSLEPRCLQFACVILFFHSVALTQCPTITSAPTGVGCEDSNATAVHRPTSVRGIVQNYDGAPIESAVIVTSAGGQANSDSDGSFTLTVDVPMDADTLGVTIVATINSVNYTGNRLVDLSPSVRHHNLGRVTMAAGGECEPAWIPTLGGGPGVSAPALALAVFDDGSGPALYVGGQFLTAGGKSASRIAKWDGSSWSTLGSGVGGSTPRIYSLMVYDDGSGPALFAGGRFTTAGGAPASNIAKWDGSSWSPLGIGMNNWVSTLAVFDDGSGPALFAGGGFTTAGGVTTNRIAKWDGAAWSPLGSGINSAVYALTVFDDGAGPALYAGGNFTMAGGEWAHRIAKWDGSSWAPWNSGLNGNVYALTVFDDGSGPALYVAGAFSLTVNGSAFRIAKWDGSSWSTLGSGVWGSTPRIYSLMVYDDGSGPALFAGGRFTTAGGAPASNIAKWDGSSWSPLDSGISDCSGGWCTSKNVAALALFDDGSGLGLYGAGEFTVAGDALANGIARWEGSSWTTLGTGFHDAVEVLTVFDDGSGPALYVGGSFTWIGSAPDHCIAKWDGSSWSALSSGMALGSRVYALTEFDDGTGPALYAGGRFITPGGLVAVHVLKWDGLSWSSLGNGFHGCQGYYCSSVVYALAVFDDGSGPALYAGGDFTTADGITVNHVAKWNGSSWSSLGSGMNNAVHSLAVYDDGLGAGPALYAGGEFTTAGGEVAHAVAKWNGSSWSPWNSGLNGNVLALAVFNDGSGPALYAGGSFTTAGGVIVNRIAKWDGLSWSPLDSGVNGWVRALSVFDDGLGVGPAFYAGGSFTDAGGAAVDRIAKWDGSSWSPLGGGFIGSTISTLQEFDDGSGAPPALYVGGSFHTSTVGDSYLTKYQGCSPQPKCPGDLNHDGGVDVYDLLILLSVWGSCKVSCPADLNGDGVVDVSDLLILLSAWGRCP